MVFEPEEYVWFHMIKKRFLLQRQFKLHPREDDPFQVLSKINDNAYKIELASQYDVSSPFNIYDLSPFYVGDDELNSWSNSLQEGINDEDMNHQDLSEATQNLGGPMTKERARRVNGTLTQFMTKPMESIDQLRGNESRLVILIQTHEDGMTCGLAALF